MPSVICVYRFSPVLVLMSNVFSGLYVALFSCHGGRSTYTPVRPICRQIHQHAFSPWSETIGLLTDSCIPVGCVDRSEPWVMQAADQVTVGGWGI